MKHIVLMLVALLHMPLAAYAIDDSTGGVRGRVDKVLQLKGNNGGTPTNPFAGASPTTLAIIPGIGTWKNTSNAAMVFTTTGYAYNSYNVDAGGCFVPSPSLAQGSTGGIGARFGGGFIVQPGESYTASITGAQFDMSTVSTTVISFDPTVNLSSLDWSSTVTRASHVLDVCLGNKRELTNTVWKNNSVIDNGRPLDGVPSYTQCMATSTNCNGGGGTND